MIYTSNYARQGNNPLALSISRKPPNWFIGNQLLLVAPTWDIIMAGKTGKITHEQSTQLYLKLLQTRNIDPSIITNLPDGTMLLCYESPTDFCHRHILADWVKNKTGIVIEEWRNENEQSTHNQQKLVDELFMV